MAYTENRWQGNPYRQEYLDGINQYIKTLREKADETRSNYAKNIYAIASHSFNHIIVVCTVKKA